METKVIIEGNAVYEIDEACMKKLREEEKNNGKSNPKNDKNPGGVRGNKRNEYR